MPDPKDRAAARHFAMCLMGAPDDVALQPAVMRMALRRMVECFQKFKRDAAIGSSMRRSAARVDELIYGPKYNSSEEISSTLDLAVGDLSASFEDLLG